MVDEEALEVPDDSEIPDLRRLLQVGPAGAGSRSACSGRAGAAAALIVVGRPRLALRPPLGRRRSRPRAAHRVQVHYNTLILESWAETALDGEGGACRRRDCHSAATPSPFSRCFNRDEEGMSAE